MNKSSSSPRVLLIAPQPFFMNRGTPINVRAMASVLADLGYSVDLLVFPFGSDVAMPGVTILRSPRIPGIRSVPIGPSWRKVLLDLLLALKAFCLVISRKYCVIQGVEEGGFIAYALGRVRGVPSIFDMDSCMVTQLESSGFVRSTGLLRLIAAIERHCISRSTAVITVCQALTAKVAEFAPQALVCQIEDFPLDGVESVEREQVESLRREFSLADVPVILYTGNFESYQGVELLIEAFAGVLARYSGSVAPKLVLVGGERAHIEKLRALASRHGIERHVAFAGQRPASEMGAFMKAADVLVSPRLSGNNTPLKLYTYLKMNKPVVATRIASHTQVLDDSTAFLAAPESESLAAALVQSLDFSEAGRARRDAIATKGHQLVETRYSRQNFSTKLADLYQKITMARASNSEISKNAVGV